MSSVAGTLTLIVSILALLSLVLLPIIFFKLRSVKSKLKSAQISLKELEQEAEPLRKYKVILDAEAEALKIINRAEMDAKKLDAEVTARVNTLTSNVKIKTEYMLKEAVTNKEQADKEAKTTLAEARAKSKEMRERAQKLLNESSAEAERIIIGAKERAEEVAGQAWEAKGKADQYEKAAVAMKNIIDGYGDEYVVPSRSVLDDLAEDFGHKEAGGELKIARSHTVALVKTAWLQNVIMWKKTGGCTRSTLFLMPLTARWTPCYQK